MRKKFLQGAATLSMAAAVCIMGGLVTASAGTVDADSVAIDYDKQQLVVTLKPEEQEVPAKDVKKEELNAIVDQFVNKDGSVLLKDAKKDDVVSLAVFGKEKDLKLGTETSYVLADGRKINKVTITAELKTTDPAQTVLDTSTGTWKLKKAVSEFKSEGADADVMPQFTVKATASVPTEGGSTTVESDPVDITLKMGVKKPSSDDREVLFNVAKVDRSNKLKASAWEVYDIGTKNKVAIDLASLNTQKDNYVQVKGDVTGDVVTIMIPKTDNTMKLKMNGATGKVEMTRGTDDSKKADLEFRTQYSGWQTYGAVSSEKVADLSLYQERGANLYFRLASADGQVTAGEPDEKLNITDKVSNKKIDVVSMPSLPGKEVKVAVAKKANAPKATVNYKKGTVTIPKGALYRVNDENGLGKFTETATSAKVELKDGDEFKKLLAGGALEVKKAGDASKKKAESKVFLLEIPNPKETLELAKGDPTKDVKDNIVKDGEKFVTASSEVVNDNKGKPASIKLTVKNGTDFDYEVVVDKSTPGADKRGKVVKAGKDATIARIDKGGSTVWIRKCADQKKAIWTTNYIQMGIIPEAKTEGEQDPGKETVTKDDLKAIADEFLATSISINEDKTENEVVKIGKDGAEFDLTKNAFEITKDGVKKKIEGVKVSIGEITKGGVDNDKEFITKGNEGTTLIYGKDIAEASKANKVDNKVSAKIVFTYGEGADAPTYSHTINFIYAK